MTPKSIKIIYLISTVLLSIMMLLSASMYFIKYDMIANEFTKLGFPLYIIYPLAIAKIIGIIALWVIKCSGMKQWAYAGFFFNFILALSAHINIKDEKYLPAIIALVLLLTSNWFDRKLMLLKKASNEDS